MLCGCVRVSVEGGVNSKKRKKRDGDCGDYEEILAGGKVVIFIWVSGYVWDESLFLYFKNIFKKIIFFIYFYFKLIFFKVIKIIILTRYKK
jgi:hypothetical protein